MLTRGNKEEGERRCRKEDSAVCYLSAFMCRKQPRKKIYMDAEEKEKRKTTENGERERKEYC